MVLSRLTFVNNAYVCPAGRHNGGIGTYSGLTKPVQRCLALAQRERFSKVLKHQVNRFRTIVD
ncbi:hypothetical protein EUY02_09595 [Neisseria meningitidis]|nr:hypothetical protein EUY02_09595 [Neisseria meningitidis]